ncbi:SLC13 family permease [Sulfitobacter sp. KE43]|uniref:SLC13 family permease n=1 Tax=Sulfitobacter sp. KE43 TaxID=2731156 RepID=UPI0023E10A4F|nr:SLC13 family permease [Sulfitobacter sp. KE43]MDF3423966.1 sodium:sulfate symporter [Sulfitobacter sp. KE43]
MTHRLNVPADTINSAPFPWPSFFKWMVVFCVTGASVLFAQYILPGAPAAPVILAAVCLALWATGIVPEAWTALLFILVASVLGLAAPIVVFSGFTSPTFWLFFAGLVLSAAMTHTGLGQSVSPLVGRFLGQSYRMAVAGCVLAGVLLAFVLPSAMVRLMILLPVVGLLVEEAGYETGSNGRTGMLLGAAFGTFLPAFAILPANTPNMILSGSAEAIYGLRVSYFNYLLLHFPVLGMLKALCLIIVVPLLFPAPAPQKIKRAAPPRLSPAAKRLGFVLMVTLGLWLTDGIHGISPAWIGMAAALVCLVPHSGLVSPTCLKTDIGLGGLLFLAGFLGVGAIIADAGVGDALAEAAKALPDVTGKLQGIGLVAGFSAVIATLTNVATVPVIVTPLAETLAGFSGLGLSTVLMAQVIAFSTPLLPYQAPPLIVAKEIANLSLGVITKLCLVMFPLTVLVLLPLDILWWHILGRL